MNNFNSKSVSKLLCLALLTTVFVTGCGTTPSDDSDESPKTKSASKAPSIPTKIMDDDAVTPVPVASKVKLPWSYEGETGPAFWGVLDPMYSTCAQGQKQSPVDLKFKAPAKGHTLKFDYKASAVKVTDLGHTFQVDFDPGSKLSVGSNSYALKHMHIRSSSEHTLSGHELPIELQLFHENDKGKWAAVSVIVIEGKVNTMIEKLLPMLPGSTFQTVGQPGTQLNASDLVPSKLTHYNYMGSLSYPPCTEGVEWNVLNTPITASSDQILALRKHYSSNKRSVQPLNGRKVRNY
jgi:carbonic anhydrase